MPVSFWDGGMVVWYGWVNGMEKRGPGFKGNYFT